MMKNIMQKWFKLIGGKMGLSFLIASCLLMLSGCHPLQQSESDKIDPYEKNFEIVGSEKDELIGKVNPAIFTTVDRSNKEAEQVESDVLYEGRSQGHPSTGTIFDFRISCGKHFHLR